MLYALFESRFGGAHQRIVSAAALLTKSGITTEIVLPDRPGNAHERAAQAGIPTHRIKMRRVPNPRRAGQLVLWLLSQPIEIVRFARCFRRLKPDAVNVSGAFFVAPSLAAKILGIPLVWQLNDTITPDPLSRVLGWLVRSLATRTIAQGHAVAGHYGFTGDSYECIYSGVDVTRFRPSTGDSMRIAGAHRIRIGMAANWNPIKDLKTFVAAASTVHSQLGDRVTFVLAGSRLETQEEYASEVMAMITSDPILEERFELHDHLDDTAPLISSLDILVMCSINEGCPNVVLEAMASGVAVVATDVGCVTELLAADTAARAGAVVDPCDSHAVANAVLAYSEDENLRLDAGKSGRRRAQDFFSLQRYADNHKALYRRVCGM